MKKTIEKHLRDACENDFGSFEATPGTDMTRKLSGLSKYARTEMLRRGYIDNRGLLTRKGYDAA